MTLHRQISELPSTTMCLRCGWIPIEGMVRYLEIHSDTATCVRCGDNLPQKEDPYTEEELGGKPAPKESR